MMQYNTNIKSLSYSTLFFSRYTVMSFDVFTTGQCMIQVFWDVEVSKDMRFPTFRRNVSS